ncbi:MAG TPA: hypothetical protein VFP00_11630 [Burkholderiales bacterium]|nr:hypothetical protein [Burkholderiales bacterium]
MESRLERTSPVPLLNENSLYRVATDSRTISGERTGAEELGVSWEASHRQIAGTIQEHRHGVDAMHGRQQREKGIPPLQGSTGEAGRVKQLPKLPRLPKVPKLASRASRPTYSVARSAARAAARPDIHSGGQMFTTLLLAGALTAGPVATSLLRADGLGAAALQQAGGTQAGRVVTVSDAAPFLGEWTLALQGPDRAGTFGLSIRPEKETVVADITSEALPKQAISEITISEKSLLLAYSFTWEGNPVDAVVTLTLEQDGKVKAQIDFAHGAYIMTGSARKKEKAA